MQGYSRSCTIGYPNPFTSYIGQVARLAVRSPFRLYVTSSNGCPGGLHYRMIDVNEGIMNIDMRSLSELDSHMFWYDFLTWFTRWGCYVPNTAMLHLKITSAASATFPIDGASTFSM